MDEEQAVHSVQADGVIDGQAVVCEVFRSPRSEGMYLYVRRSEGLARVPEALLQRFGEPESALVFRLHAGRRLARASADEVLDALAEPGFYLQLPPVPGAEAALDGQLNTAGRAPPPRTTDASREDPWC